MRRLWRQTLGRLRAGGQKQPEIHDEKIVRGESWQNGSAGHRHNSTSRPVCAPSVCLNTKRRIRVENNKQSKETKHRQASILPPQSVGHGGQFFRSGFRLSVGKQIRLVPRPGVGVLLQVTFRFDDLRGNHIPAQNTPLPDYFRH